MKYPPHLRAWLLVGAALGLLAVLIAVPATRWIVQKQAYITLPVRAPRPESAPEREVAARYPRDFQIQYAYELSQNASTSMAPTDRDAIVAQALIKRFPNNPAGYAHLLRYMTLGPVRLHRRESDLFMVRTPTSPDSTASNEVTAPESLAIYEKAAAAGEHIEPGNAYFSVMHAFALFEGRQDEQALAALIRAGEKPRWEDYALDEPIGQDRLYILAYGEGGALNRLSRAAAVLFPHYAQMRSTARVAMYLAVQKEKSGHVSEGIAPTAGHARPFGQLGPPLQSMLRLH